MVGVMNTSKLARATFVLSKSANDDLSYLSRRMKQSRSSLVREVLEPGIVQLAQMLRAVPDKPTQEDLDDFANTAISEVDGLSSHLKRELRRG